MLYFATMISQSKLKIFDKKWLVFSLICVILPNVVWIFFDRSPALWDIAGHSQRAALMADLLFNGALGEVILFDGIYPPFTYLVTAIGFILAGWQVDLPQYSLIIFLVLYVVAIGSIAMSLFKDRTVAVAAGIVSLAFPLLMHFTRIYDLDFPLTAVVTAALAALLLSKNLTNRKWVMWFAVAAGAALLTKWTAIIFLVGPVLIVLGSALHKKRNRSAVLMNALIGLLIILAVAGPWYLAQGGEILASAATTRDNVFSVPYENLLSWGNLTYYAKQLTLGVTPVFALFFVIGAVFIASNNRKAAWFIFAWIVVPYLIMTFALYSKESRYFLPVFPAVALAIAALFQVKKRSLRIGVASILIIFGLFFWTETSWGVRIFPDQVYKVDFFDYIYGYKKVTPEKVRYGFTYPTAFHTNIPEIVTAIDNDLEASLPDKNAVVNVAVVPNSIFLTAQQIQYYARLAGIDRIANDYSVDYSLSTKIRESDWQDHIYDADYLITKTGDQGPKIWGRYLKQVRKEEKVPNSPVFNQFELMESFELNGIESQPQEARLYKRN